MPSDAGTPDRENIGLSWLRYAALALPTACFLGYFMARPIMFALEFGRFVPELAMRYQIDTGLLSFCVPWLLISSAIMAGMTLVMARLVAGRPLPLGWKLYFGFTWVVMGIGLAFLLVLIGMWTSYG